MKKRYTEEQILAVLRQAEQGKPLAELLRENGIAAPLIRKKAAQLLFQRSWAIILATTYSRGT